MPELSYLRGMWANRIRRTERLIIEDVTADLLTGSFGGDWFFSMAGAFREALDIRYVERVKDKKKKWVWTQGAILRFKEGDFITARDHPIAVQVYYANPMGWDSEVNAMYEGAVTFDVYSIEKGKFLKGQRRSVTQMQFFEMLISGQILIGSEVFSLASTSQLPTQKSQMALI